MIIHKDLRSFIKNLAKINELKYISEEIDPFLEITEFSRRILQKSGPALFFQNPKGYKIPILTNLFGSLKRIALAMGFDNYKELRKIGELLAELKQITPPKNFRDGLSKIPLIKKIFDMKPKIIKYPVCQEVIINKKEVDLLEFPIQTCWPKDISPLITWGLVTTKNLNTNQQNIGIYRQQIVNRNQLVIRWLKHRNGAINYQIWKKKYRGKKFPIAISLGTDPIMALAAVSPIPNNLSEYAFAGLLRNKKMQIAHCLGNELDIPAHAEIILEGYLDGTLHPEGPFGDHTGYYNTVEKFPLCTIERITHRVNPIYHSTYTGRPPDEPSILGVALNEIFIPILQKQFPEIIDFYLPPEGCSYRLAIVSIKKLYPGHAKRISMGIWSYLTQLMYTKFIFITSDDINIRNWKDVIWSLTTRVDPMRDVTIIDNTPIDYLDFSSHSSDLGSKMAIDATNKLPGETKRSWGKSIHMDTKIKEKINNLLISLSIL